MFSEASRQILEDTRLTDAQGRTVDFKTTATTMTSNPRHGRSCARPRWRSPKQYEAVTSDKMRFSSVNEALKQHFLL